MFGKYTKHIGRQILAAALAVSVSIPQIAPVYADDDMYVSNTYTFYADGRDIRGNSVTGNTFYTGDTTVSFEMGDDGYDVDRIKPPELNSMDEYDLYTWDVDINNLKSTAVYDRRYNITLQRDWSVGNNTYRWDVNEDSENEITSKGFRITDGSDKAYIQYLDSEIYQKDDKDCTINLGMPVPMTADKTIGAYDTYT